MHSVALLQRIAIAAARRYVMRPHLSIEDLAQEALAVLIESSIQDNDIPEMHLYNVARRRCRNIYRREICRQRGRITLPLELVAARIASPIGVAQENEIRSLVHVKLDEDVAFAIDCHYLKGMTVLETAYVMNVKFRRAEYLLRIGRRRLKEIIKMVE